MEPEQSAICQIEDADLPAPIYRTARRLLDFARCHPDGYLRLTKPELRRLCGTESDGTMRSHLIQLSNAGIIDYCTNEVVYVSFLAWARAQRSSTRGQRSNFSHNTQMNCDSLIAQHATDANLCSDRALSDLPRALSDQEAVLPHTRIGLVGLDLNPDPDPEDLDPNQTKPDPDARARLRGLLIDVGVSPPAAHRLSDMDVDLGVRMVFDWLPEYQAGLAKVNLLVWRLQHGETAPPLRDSARASPLYRKHFPDLALEPPRAASWHEIADEYNSYTVAEAAA